ncbi:MAG: Ig-like domain-containing protein [bacterium]
MKALTFGAGIPALPLLAVSLLNCSGPTGPDLTPPTVRITSPAANSTVSRRLEPVIVSARDNDAVAKVEFFVEGRRLETATSKPWQFTWNTVGQPDGHYELKVKAHDGAGNVSADSLTVDFVSLEAFVGDTIAITEIKVSGIIDGGFNGPTRLEVEVHMYEQGSNRFLGCSGRGSGLRTVDESDVLYTVEAFFQKPVHGTDLLTFGDVIDRVIYLRVIEDDADECPSPANSTPDDAIGVSAPFDGVDLFTASVMQFDKVSHLRIGRKTN